MARPEQIVVWVVCGADMIGPAVLLLLLRRWTKNWWVALACVVVALPMVFGLATGGIARAQEYRRVVVRGDTSVVAKTGDTVPAYLDRTFVMCAMYGTLIAGTGFGLSLPLLGAWWLIHRSSFDRLTRS